MLFFIADGRLGNQMFQYAFLNTLKTNKERVIVFGFNELVEAFENIDANIINISISNKLLKKVFTKVLYKILKPLFSYAANKKIISSVYVNRDCIFGYERELDSYTEEIGFFYKIKYIYLGFFQSEAFFNKNLIEFKIKKCFQVVADHIMSDIPINSYKVFIHVRYGDYKNHYIYGKSAVLPLQYYYKLINFFLENKKEVFFIILSDDIEYIKKNFSHINHSIILKKNHPAVDLEIMSNCIGGILSASSFSWWGAYLMKKRDIVFAPKYWMGFNSKIYYHCNSIPDFCIEVDT